MKAKYDKREAEPAPSIKFSAMREKIYQYGSIYIVQFENRYFNMSIARFRDPVRAKLLAKALNDAVKSSMKGTVPFK